jgi:hypothetical protein
MVESRKKCLLIFTLALFLSITIGYPALFLTDEWITADQLNHIVEGKDLLYGYEPYGSMDYKVSHHNTLCYTLALPSLAVPAFLLFYGFQDCFRLLVIILWATLALVLCFCVERWFPQYARIKGIPWTYGVAISVLILSVLNFWLYTPFRFVRAMQPYDPLVYPEVAAIVFTNSLAFALLAVVAFLIFREIFGSDRWGLFGLAATVCCSSYLFWSGNAKDHALVALLFAVALYCFTLYLSRENTLYLFASFIAVGWTAWARPELGPALAAGLFLFGVAVAAGKGWREAGKAVLAAAGVPLGALPLLVNNWGLSGSPLILPWTAGYAAAAGKAPQGFLSTVAGQYASAAGPPLRPLRRLRRASSGRGRRVLPGLADLVLRTPPRRSNRIRPPPPQADRDQPPRRPAPRLLRPRRRPGGAHLRPIHSRDVGRAPGSSPTCAISPRPIFPCSSSASTP